MTRQKLPRSVCPNESRGEKEKRQSVYVSSHRRAQWIPLIFTAMVALGVMPAQTATAGAPLSGSEKPDVEPVLVDELGNAIRPKRPRTEADGEHLEALSLFSAGDCTSSGTTMPWHCGSTNVRCGSIHGRRQSPGLLSLWRRSSDAMPRRSAMRCGWRTWTPIPNRNCSSAWRSI